MLCSEPTASFACLMPLTTLKPQNTDTNGIHATLLFTILTIIITMLRSELKAHSFTFSCAYPQYNDVSGCVCADAFNGFASGVSLLLSVELSDFSLYLFMYLLASGSKPTVVC